MRRFVALALFTSSFFLCTVALAYADKLSPESRYEMVAKSPAVVADTYTVDRPSTPGERLQNYPTVIDGAVILPEARCNGPGLTGIS